MGELINVNVHFANYLEAHAALLEGEYAHSRGESHKHPTEQESNFQLSSSGRELNGDERETLWTQTGKIKTLQ